MSRLVVALLPVAFVVSSCAHGSTQVKPKATACERARATALDAPRRDVLRGDVDGDGVPDSVALIHLRRAPQRCGVFLVVWRKGRALTKPFARTGLPVPQLNGLAKVAPGRLHIVMTTWMGASTAFARVLTIRGSRISYIAASTYGGTFPYEGGVTHFNGIDCAGPDVIVATGVFSKSETRPRFGFERQFYRLRKRRFELIRTQRGTTDRPFFHEFRAPQPFPSCMRVRAEPAQ